MDLEARLREPEAWLHHLKLSEFPSGSQDNLVAVKLPSCPLAATEQLDRPGSWMMFAGSVAHKAPATTSCV